MPHRDANAIGAEIGVFLPQQDGMSGGGGAVHPFVGAGLGAYFLQHRDNGQDAGDGATKFGGAIFGGLEFFTSKTFAVKGEARYHVVTNWNGYNPSGLALTIGAKAYF